MEYRTYFAKTLINVYVDDFTEEQSDQKRIHKGHVYFGSRINSDLMEKNDFYKKVALYHSDEIDEKNDGDNPLHTTNITFRSQTDMVALGFIRIFRGTIEPVDGNRIYAPYGKKHNCTVAGSCEQDVREQATTIGNFEFNFGDDQNPLIYKFNRQTLKLLSGRKYNAGLSFQ